MRFKPSLYSDDGEPGNFVKHEDRIAKKFNGHKQAGSGASDYAKSDVKLDKFMIEAKTTSHASMSIKKEWLAKITAEATAVQKYPAMSIEIGGNPDPLTEDGWMIIPESVFKKLLMFLEEEDG